MSGTGTCPAPSTQPWPCLIAGARRGAKAELSILVPEGCCVYVHTRVQSFNGGQERLSAYTGPRQAHARPGSGKSNNSAFNPAPHTRSPQAGDSNPKSITL